MSPGKKNFLKFVAGFVGIIILALGTLLCFEYWQKYNQDKETKNLLKEIKTENEQAVHVKPAINSPSENIPNAPNE